MSSLSDERVLKGFQEFDADITKEYFYGYCRRAYNVFDGKYQLRKKGELDFYSLAHDYYIGLMTQHFKPLLDKPGEIKLSTWMVRGFHFVVLDALKAYNKNVEHRVEDASDVVLEYVRSTDEYNGMLCDVVEAVATHYNDRVMNEIAYMVIYAGFKQKEVAEQLGVTPAAVNLRYKKIMDEVVVPFVVENYSKGIYGNVIYDDTIVAHDYNYSEMAKQCIFEDNYLLRYMENSMKNRITPDFITSLEPNEIFVFGSNLLGMHAGGAARMAHLKFGAEMGKGVGIQGQSYAIPTMQGGVETIKPYVDEFIEYARQHSNLIFYVTPIGCGIAGFEPQDIAPLFDEAKNLQNVYLPESFREYL